MLFLTPNQQRQSTQVAATTESPLVIGVEDTEDSKPKDGRAEVYK